MKITPTQKLSRFLIPEFSLAIIQISDDRVIRIKLADLEPIIQKKPSELSTSSSVEEPSVKTSEEHPSKKRFWRKK